MTSLLKDFGNVFDTLDRAASSSFENAVDRAGAWEDRLVDGVGNSVISRIDLWLVHHPLLSWLIHHPIVSLVLAGAIAVLAVRLFLTIYRAIASAIDRMWLLILRSPFILLKFLFGWEVKPKTNSVNTTITNYEVTNNPEQLEQIMIAIKQIQQQQQQIIEDLEQLKGRSPNVNEAKRIDLSLPATKK